jgi:hypothetical protein
LPKTTEVISFATTRGVVLPGLSEEGGEGVGFLRIAVLFGAAISGYGRIGEWEYVDLLVCEVEVEALLLVNRLIGAACRWRAEKRHAAAVRAWVFVSPHSDWEFLVNRI